MTLRVTDPFIAYDGLMRNAYRPGDLVSDDDPVVVGRERHFENVDDGVRPPAAREARERPEPVGDTIDDLDIDELREIAEDMGLNTRGSRDVLAARVAEAIAVAQRAADSPDAVEVTDIDAVKAELENRTKAQLVELLTEAGIEHEPRAPKAELIDLLAPVVDLEDDDEDSDEGDSAGEGDE